MSRGCVSSDWSNCCSSAPMRSGGVEIAAYMAPKITSYVVLTISCQKTFQKKNFFFYLANYLTSTLI